ncbi:hypothetical protein SPSIL_039900 [Sporomusa silvacetica DSM 10669]|uniref:Major facilitator superfamily (MFS) profile domain-containing protein n=1 Tax=Sporomusa silvacetica DSM 10669 TaxID=1123289 RepID=A0ABZ3IQF3_9FIRM|nr:MFS transporter [Sporomusa silvacetica]OZC16295.1 putative MFS-type transporter YhjX [Sporomusa silvacetica DSM 10669]
MTTPTLETGNKKFHYGFIVAAALFVLMLPASLIMNVASIFYVPVSRDLGVSVTAYAVTTSIIQLTMAFCAPTLFSKICRQFNMRWVLGVCLLVEALSFAARAMAGNIWVIYITSALIAFPMSIFFSFSIPLLMNSWFPWKTGTMIGIVAAAQGLGGMFFSSVGSVIIADYGWRTCFWVFGGICLVFIPIALLFIRATPAEKGLKPFGFEKMQSDSGKTEAATVLGGISAEKAMRMLPFYLVIIAIPLTAFIAGISFFFNAYSQSIGFSVVFAGAIASIIQAGTMFFKLTLGIVSDKSVRLGGIYYVSAACVTCILLIFAGSNEMAIAIASFLFGGIYSATNLYGPVLVKYVFGLKDFTKIWARVTGVVTLAGAFGSSVWGLIIESTSYRTGFSMALLALVVLLVLIIIMTSKTTTQKTKEAWTTENAESVKQ